MKISKDIRNGFNRGYEIGQGAQPDLLKWIKAGVSPKTPFSKALKLGIEYAEMRKRLQQIRKSRSLLKSKSRSHDR